MEKESVVIERLERRISRLQVGFVFAAAAWLASAGWLAFELRSTPSVLTVERLEIVEPDGTPALILANSQRPAAATVDGRVVMGGQDEERKGIPSIIFFDGKGDEVGGMLFGSRESADGFSATRHLSLDAFGQDQTVVLAHYQDPNGSTSGLTISNRPTHSMLETFAQLGLQPGATRGELTAAIAAIPQAERAQRRLELFGTTRAFFGSTRERQARLALMDGQGRNRILIETPEEGDPSIQILDEQGHTVLRLP